MPNPTDVADCVVSVVLRSSRTQKYAPVLRSSILALDSPQRVMHVVY